MTPCDYYSVPAYWGNLLVLPPWHRNQKTIILDFNSCENLISHKSNVTFYYNNFKLHG